MAEPGVPVRYSVSTWQQPLPTTMSAARTAVIRSVADRILALGNGRLRVAIDGPTAAGKSSLGHELAVVISDVGRPVLRASLDDFKRPWSERHLYDRESGEGYFRNAFDYAAVKRLLLEPCGERGSGLPALCSIDPLTQIDHSGVLTPMGADGVLIVDGVFALRDEINDFWDLRIWVDVDPETSLRRGANRDADWAGAEAEEVHRNRYAVAVGIYVEEVDPLGRSDVVIDNSDFAEPRLSASGHDDLSEGSPGVEILER